MHVNVSTQTWKFPVHRWDIPIYGWVRKYLCLWMGLSLFMYGLHRFLILYFILFSCDLGWLGGRTSYCSYVIYQPSPFLYLPFFYLAALLSTLRTDYGPLVPDPTITRTHQISTGSPDSYGIHSPTVTKFSLLWTQINLRTRFMFWHAPFIDGHKPIYEWDHRLLKMELSMNGHYRSINRQVLFMDRNMYQGVLVPVHVR